MKEYEPVLTINLLQVLFLQIFKKTGLAVHPVFSSPPIAVRLRFSALAWQLKARDDALYTEVEAKVVRTCISIEKGAEPKE
jgi:hypothetical protein